MHRARGEQVGQKTFIGVRTRFTTGRPARAETAIADFVRRGQGPSDATEVELRLPRMRAPALGAAVVVRRSTFEIPPPHVSANDPALRDFALPSWPRVAALLASCTTLWMPVPALATAGPPALPDPPAVQRPNDPPPDSASENDETSSLPGPPALSPDVDPEDVIESPSPPTQPPAPVPSRAAVSSDADLDLQLRTLEGRKAVLLLRDGSKLDVVIGHVSHTSVGIIHVDEGHVQIVDKHEIESVALRPPPELPKGRGVGMIVGGGLMSFAGLPLFATGLTFLGIYPQGVFLHLPMLLIGGGLLGGGIPLIVYGARRNTAWNQAMHERTSRIERPRFHVARTRHGWTGGLSLRF